ncbi:MAG: energy-coupling factor transporter transmembrane component T [Sporolactobacillus sp.]
MSSISLYVDRESFVHDVDFMTKLIFCVVFIVAPIISGSPVFELAAVLMTSLFIVVAHSFRRFIPILLLSLLVLFSVVIVQSAFVPGYQVVLFSLGPVTFYKTGLIHGLEIVVRFLDILFPTSLVVLTTKPIDMVVSLQHIGLSYRFAYVIQSIFQIIPQMTAAMRRIANAQRSRGLKTDGRLLTRARAFLPLIGPVMIGSLIDTRERAMALEARGFSAEGQRTFFHIVPIYRYRIPVRVFLVAVLIFSIYWRLH